MSQFPRRCIGVDFSGATDAGRHIWIAQGSTEAGSLFTIEGCQPLTHFSQGVHARDQVLPVLREWIANQPNAVIGLDFPFSLPQQQINAPNWLAFADLFSTRYPTAESLFDDIGGRGKELRRTCDQQAHTPFAPGNLRLFRQTYYGIRDVLAPLVTQKCATLWPMQDPIEGLPQLIEACPAVTLRVMGLKIADYKSAHPESEQRRKRLVDALLSQGVEMSSQIQQVVVEQSRGDALDSIIAAYGTLRAIRAGLLDAQPTALERIEGRVYG